jgi:hypothetical protein
MTRIGLTPTTRETSSPRQAGSAVGPLEQGRAELLLDLTDPTTDRTVASDEAGVKRISIGGSGSRFALNAFLSAAREMAEHGTFTFVGGNPPWRELLDGFAKGRG